MDIYRITLRTDPVNPPQIAYAGNVPEGWMNFLDDRAEEIVPAPLPTGIPKACRALLEAADAAGLLWQYDQGEYHSGVLHQLRIHGLDPAAPKRIERFAWYDTRLNPYGLPMPLKRAHELIAERAAEADARHPTERSNT